MSSQQRNQGSNLTGKGRPKRTSIFGPNVSAIRPTLPEENYDISDRGLADNLAEGLASAATQNESDFSKRSGRRTRQSIFGPSVSSFRQPECRTGPREENEVLDDFDQRSQSSFLSPDDFVTSLMNRNRRSQPITSTQIAASATFGHFDGDPFEETFARPDSRTQNRKRVAIEESDTADSVLRPTKKNKNSTMGKENNEEPVKEQIVFMNLFRLDRPVCLEGTDGLPNYNNFVKAPQGRFYYGKDESSQISCSTIHIEDIKLPKGQRYHGGE